ncbi:MAG TPA: hypothetical protein VLI06_02195 [Solimonas sp.]|nr:hypothetical protein [Solimonas sp.]
MTPSPSLKAVFRGFLLLSILGTIVLAIINAGITNAAVPQGIVSFEFCGFTGTCAAALDSWGEPGRNLTMLSLGLDYLYLLSYSGLIWSGLLLLAGRLPQRWQAGTRGLAWIAPLAGLCDAIENYALIRIVIDGPGETAGLIAGVFASIKFGIVAITLGWLLFASLAWALPAARRGG